ncbi:MAG: hypothetical protein F4150_01075, partial [Chloroflexi bacterium]|nr:hypothetical protein [Chloroflexota bacterium]
MAIAAALALATAASEAWPWLAGRREAARRAGAPAESCAVAVPSATGAASCPTRTIDDAPADEDAFGAYEAKAAAIHGLITGERGGRTIGLEGRWGSGKSTIVGLLERRLTGPDSLVFVFDAWAHEGDPLRRSFLQKQIGRLYEGRWIDEAARDARLAELTARRRVEHTRLGLLAVAVALTALVLPVSTALISGGL